MSKKYVKWSFKGLKKVRFREKGNRNGSGLYRRYRDERIGIILPNLMTKLLLLTVND